MGGSFSALLPAPRLRIGRPELSTPAEVMNDMLTAAELAGDHFGIQKAWCIGSRMANKNYFCLGVPCIRIPAGGGILASLIYEVTP